ncbi:ATP-binding protein [Azospirillum sp. SYSU D00513]|uniref:ATP-binding protein n=1 Tax=Azospirillum sp. SYSU D00513 TaxID=2812561 RepID=UPI001A960260|nr:ATP-binding protein [Azospirillum sp. SYSU D00513]
MDQTGNQGSGTDQIGPERARTMVRERMEGRTIDIDACAREPIHIPGTVQPHGALLAFDPETRRVAVCGGNTEALLGAGPQAVLGQDAGDCLSAPFVEAALSRWKAGELSFHEPLRLTLAPRPGASAPLTGWVHVSGGLILAEAVTDPAEPAGQTSIQGIVNRVLGTLQRARTVEELSRTMARAMRALSGFERVLVYRFDPDWNGETIAEDKVADWTQSFLGLRSPSSDIPAQARDLYTKNLIRFVPDIDHAAVPLLSTPDRRDTPLDLSGARLRSLSPVHREYQRNIGVKGSMSASVLKDGTLWGLIIGHHRNPHRVSPDAEEAILTLARAFGMRLYQVETGEAQAERNRQMNICSRLIGQAAGQRDLAGALTGRELDLGKLFGASGAALVLDGDVHPAGAAPPRADVAGLADWIRDTAPEGSLFTAHDLPHRYVPFVKHAKTASGVLAAFLGEGRNDMLLWFRPQEAETVAWAGEPTKRIEPGNGGNMILPRQNFELWREVRAGYSNRWQDWELETADELRRAVEGVMARRLDELREVQDRIENIRRLEALERLRIAKEEAERASVAKSRFLAAASHDLRQPVQSLLLFLESLAPHVRGEQGREAMRHLGRGMDALKMLLDGLLDLSSLDAGVTQPVIEEFPAAGLLGQLAADFASVAAAKGLDFQVGQCAASLRSDRTLLRRMLNNLVENAVRYTESGRIAIECHPAGGHLRIEVHDTGAGIPSEHLDLIWDEFHQLGNPERDRNHGLGLGLSIVQRLSGLLGHPVEVRSMPGQGSVFSVEVPLGKALPARPPAATAETTGNGRLVLLVDDDSIVLLALKSVFEAWGYGVLAAGSCDEAVRMLREAGQAPDIVVADYRLRERRFGTEVILKVREMHGTGVPGVILTGETGPEARRDSLTHGFELMHKPVTPRQLGEILGKLLPSA